MIVAHVAKAQPSWYVQKKYQLIWHVHIVLKIATRLFTIFWLWAEILVFPCIEDRKIIYVLCRVVLTCPTDNKLAALVQIMACHRTVWHSTLTHRYTSPDPTVLTHWGRDKMDAISQTTLSNAISWKKMLEFRLRFHWSLFLRVQLTIIQHWFR